MNEISKDRIKFVIGIINNLIVNHEFADSKHFVSDSKLQSYRSGLEKSIYYSLHVMSALTGQEYTWVRRETSTESYSGICIFEDGKVKEAYENCLERGRKRTEVAIAEINAKRKPIDGTNINEHEPINQGW